MEPAKTSPARSERAAPGGDRRSHRRYANRLSVRVVFYRNRRLESAAARLVNVSQGGLCFESETPLAPGTHLYIDLRTAETESLFAAGLPQRRAFAGTVRWCGASSPPGALPRMGVAFREHGP